MGLSSTAKGTKSGEPAKPPGARQSLSTRTQYRPGPRGMPAVGGYAGAATFPPNVRYAEYYRVLERQARAQNRGLWGSSTTIATPARRSHACRRRFGRRRGVGHTCRASGRRTPGRRSCPRPSGGSSRGLQPHRVAPLWFARRGAASPAGDRRGRRNRRHGGPTPHRERRPAPAGGRARAPGRAAQAPPLAAVVVRSASGARRAFGDTSCGNRLA